MKLQPWHERIIAQLEAHKGKRLILRNTPALHVQKIGRDKRPLTGTTSTLVILDDVL